MMAEIALSDASVSMMVSRLWSKWQRMGADVKVVLSFWNAVQAAV